MGVAEGALAAMTAACAGQVDEKRDQLLLVIDVFMVTVHAQGVLKLLQLLFKSTFVKAIGTVKVFHFQ
jgi:hypothetical protein